MIDREIQHVAFKRRYDRAKTQCGMHASTAAKVQVSPDLATAKQVAAEHGRIVCGVCELEVER